MVIGKARQQGDQYDSSPPVKQRHRKCFINDQFIQSTFDRPGSIAAGAPFDGWGTRQATDDSSYLKLVSDSSGKSVRVNLNTINPEVNIIGFYRKYWKICRCSDSFAGIELKWSSTIRDCLI